MGKDILIGKVFETTGGTRCKIISGNHKHRVRVKFLDKFGYEAETRVPDLLNGYVKNPFAPAVCGVGYLGIGKHSPSKEGAKTLAYVQWHGVIRRSYDLTYKKKQSSYEKVNVCEDWHCFDTYAEWFYSQKGWDKGYHLDKDILGDGSYKYSPETCCLVPAEVNTLVSSGSSRKGDYSVGVYYSTKERKFCSSIRTGGKSKYLGGCLTEAEAFNRYKTAKEAWIKDTAEFWKDEIERKVYDALYNLELTKDGWLAESEQAFKFYEDGSVDIPEYYLKNNHLVTSGVNND